MKKKEGPITSFRGEYSFLSNFYSMPVEVRGETYPTVEHAFQASKTNVEADRVMIQYASTPADAKRIGRRVTIKPGWDAIRVNIMHRILEVKFRKGTEEARKLLATGNRDLVEGNTWGDRFWGQCPVGKGSNVLGVLLMRIRKGLRNGEQA
jgi:hypothetical protein